MSAPDRDDDPTELDLVYNDLWQAKNRIEALEAALRKVAEHPDYECRTDGKSYALPWAFWNVKRIARAALAKEQDK